MIAWYSLLAILTLYGLLLFISGFSTLPKEVRQSLNPAEIEGFDEEMTYRQIVGLLLLFFPTMVLIVWLLFYF